MNTKLIHLVNEIFDWNLEARAELAHEELDELLLWVQADQRVVDQAVKDTQGRLARAKDFEAPALLQSLNRLLERSRKLEALEDEIARTKDTKMHKADGALEEAMGICNMAHRLVCSKKQTESVA